MFFFLLNMLRNSTIKQVAFKMSGHSSRKEVNSLFLKLQALQQQFEQLIPMFGGISSCIERPNTTIVALQIIRKS